MDILQFRCDEPVTRDEPPSGEPRSLAAHIGITVPDHATEDDLDRLMTRVCERARVTFRSQRRQRRREEGR